jgi:hypothetical protein
MKEGNGVSTIDLEQCKQTSTFRGVQLTQPSGSDKQQWVTFKARFYQALVDNMLLRFSSSDCVMHLSNVL